MRRIFYGWFMVALGALLMALGSAPLLYGLPVWNPVLRHAFGWSAFQMSGAFAIMQIEGVYAPLLGLLIDKLGPRRMVLIGLIVLGCGFMLFSRIQELWHLYAVFLIMSVGATISTWLPMMTVVNHWFSRRKALAMSLVMEGFALGGVVAPLLLAWAIGGSDPDISERYGWRNTAFFIGVFCIALAIPLSSLVRNRPEDLGLLPDGDQARPTAPSPVTPPLAEAAVDRTASGAEGYTWQEAVRTRAFWVMSLGLGGSSVVLCTVIVHLGLMLDDRGFSLKTISAAAAVYPAVAAVSILIGGGLGDRFPIRLVAFGANALQSAAVMALVLARSTEMVFLVVVLLGMGGGGRSSVSTALRGIYFGRRAFGAILGLSGVPTTIMWFVAPVYAGLMRGVTGNYDVAFLTIGAFALSCTCLFLLLGEQVPHKGQIPASPARGE